MRLAIAAAVIRISKSTANRRLLMWSRVGVRGRLHKEILLPAVPAVPAAPAAPGAVAAGARRPRPLPATELRTQQDAVPVPSRGPADSASQPGRCPSRNAQALSSPELAVAWR